MKNKKEHQLCYINQQMHTQWYFIISIPYVYNCCALKLVSEKINNLYKNSVLAAVIISLAFSTLFPEQHMLLGKFSSQYLICTQSCYNLIKLKTGNY